MTEKLSDVVFDPQALDTFKGWIESSNRFVILSHTSPDGDAVGSSLALYHFLKGLGKQVTVCLPSAYPDYFKWMPGQEGVLIHRASMKKTQAAILSSEVVCMLDFNVINRIDQMAEAVQSSKAHKILIDHHLGPEVDCDVTISSPSQCATCELLLRLLLAMGYEDRIGKVEATCLYTGMMTDTGGFTYNSSRSEIFLLVSFLLGKGIDKDLIYRKVNYNYSSGRLILQGKVLSSMQVLDDYHTAIMTLDAQQQKETNVLRGDTEGYVNLPLQIRQVILSCFLRQDTERDQVKLSFRSVGDFPCNLLAQEFGGGGHKNASGAEVPGATVEDVCIRLKVFLMKYAPLLDECFRKSPK